MKTTRVLLSFLVCLAVLVVGFVAVSLFDILVAVLYARFYSTAAFIVLFGVGGVFAGILAYGYGISQLKEMGQMGRLLIAGFIVLLGLFFFFFLAKLEGGEYEAAFKSYGITSAFAAVVLAKEKLII